MFQQVTTQQICPQRETQLVEDTVNSRLWWSGPEWLPRPKSYWLQLDVHSSSVLSEKRELKETSEAKNKTFTPVEVTTLTSNQRLPKSISLYSFA